MIYSINEQSLVPGDSDQSKEIETIQNTEDYNYLDHLRWITTNYYAIHCDVEVPEKELEVHNLKILHKKLMETNNQKVSEEEVANEWNKQIPNIPWDMN